MKKIGFSTFSLTIAILLSIGYSTFSYGHTQNGSLGNDAGAVDLYQVTCSTDGDVTEHLEMSIANVSPGSPLASVQTQIGNLAANTTDEDSSDLNFSPLSVIAGGNGVYIVTVDKAAAGGANYTLDYHCKNGTLHTATSITPLQNDMTPPPDGGGEGEEPPPSGGGDFPVLPPTDVAEEALEGKTVYTAFAVTHGCNNHEGTENLLPVIAQSSVFPNGQNSDMFFIVDGEEIPVDSLAGNIVDADNGLPDLDPGLVFGHLFSKGQSTIDDLSGNSRGILFAKLKMPTNARGLLPFYATTPRFESASCAKTLKIRIAVANYCSSKGGANRADIWIGDLTPRFNDPAVMPLNYDTEPYWPTLVVKRDPDENPLPDPEACPDGYFDIAVQPSSSDIDDYLAVPKLWP